MRFKNYLNEQDEYKNSLYNKLKKKYGPEIPKGKYIGSCRAHDCDKNTYKNRKEYDVYRGEILYYNPDYDKWVTTPHIFNVKNNKVYEFTDLDKLDFGNIYYFGNEYKGNLKNIWEYI